MEAEHVALSTAMKNLIHLQCIVKLGCEALELDPNDISSIKSGSWGENTDALTLARFETPSMTHCSKHHSIEYHWFRGFVKNESIELRKIDTTNFDGFIE